MANFGKFDITNVGLDLEYKAQAGKELKFSKFIVGDGYYTSPISVLTELVNPIMEFEVKRLNIQTLTTNKKISIGFDIDSKLIDNGFYLREIGLYAKDPDTQEDVLVFYGNAGDTADFINPRTSTTISEKLIDLELYLASIDNITAVIDSSLVYATQQDLINLQTTVNESLQDTTTQVQNEITSLKQDSAPRPFSIETTAWVQNETTQLYEAIIEDNSITENDLADVVFDSTTYSIAEEAGIKGYAVEESGAIRLFAESVPSGVVSGKYCVNRGVANG